MVSAGLRLDAAEKRLARGLPLARNARRFSSAAGVHGARSRPAKTMRHARDACTYVAAGLQTRLRERLRPGRGSSDRPWRRGRGTWSPPASGSTPRKNASRAVCPWRATLVVFHLPLAFTALAVGQRRPCATPATDRRTWPRVFRPASGNGFVQAAGLLTAPGAAVAAHGLRRPPARRRGKTPRARSALGAQRSSFFICRWRSRRSQSASEDHAPRPRRMPYVAAGLQTRLRERLRPGRGSSDRPWRRGRGTWSPPASGSTPRKNASRAVCPWRATLVVFHLPLAFTALAVGQRRPCATPATDAVRGRGSSDPPH